MIMISEIYIAQFLYYGNIVNSALQHLIFIITPALAELPIGAQMHYKE